MTLIPPSPGNNHVHLRLDHNGKSSDWNVNAWDQLKKVDLTEHINQFWARLRPEVQQKIFDAYEEIHSVLSSRTDARGLTIDLLEPIAKMMDLHDDQAIKDWIAIHSKIQEPHDIKDEFSASDDSPSKTPEKTYTTPEYRDLIAMALAQRAMVPVWGAFMFRTKEEIGNDWKEYAAFKLLNNTKMMKSAAMQKLAVYVEKNLIRDEPLVAAIMGGVSVDEYPKYLLGRTVLRRVCVGDIDARDQLTHLVKYIFNYLRQTHRPPGTLQFGRTIRDKEFEDPNRNNDNQVSRLEAYKITQDIPIGDLSILDAPFNNPQRLAVNLRPDIDLALFEEFWNHAQILLQEPPYEPQVVLTQWIMAPVIPPRGLTRLNRHRMVTAMAIAQTCLWQDAQYQLACLLTAVASEARAERFMSTNSYDRQIPKDLMRQLDELYPYQPTTQGKKKSKPINAAARAIGLVANGFDTRDWQLTLPPSLTTRVTGNPNQRRYGCPSDIRVLLAMLVIALKKNPYRVNRDKFSPLSPNYVGDKALT